MPRAGGSFRGLVSYLTSARGRVERVGSVRLTHCVSADVASALLEVENVQRRNARARHSTYHLMLSFREQPSKDVLEAIERRACEALGFGDHQRVSVVHHDTDHLHVHVAINRVHSRTHKVHWPSYSKLVLDRLCVEVEREYGLVPDRHRTRERAAVLEATAALRASLQGEHAEGLRQVRSWAELHQLAAASSFEVHLRGNGLVFVGKGGGTVKASSVSRDLSKSALERRLGPFQPSPHWPRTAVNEQLEPAARRPPDIERAAGIETLIGFIQRECAEGFRNARSWQEMHDLARTRGLQLRVRGSGLVIITSDGLAAKASSVARDLSKAALERRLGAFEAAANTLEVTRAGYQRRPMVRDERSSRLYEQYCRERDATLGGRDRAIARLRQQRGRDEERLERISQRRWAAVRLVAKGRVAWALWSAYAKQADRRDRERARARYRAGVRAAAALHPRPGWLEWLRNRAGHGDGEALALLRSRTPREPEAPRRAVWSQGAPLQNVGGGRSDGVTATGTVVYAVIGGSIRDDGKRLRLSGYGVSDAAAEALLRLAHARYGPRLGVDGDESFRSRIVRVAAAAALPITFADPQLEERRLELSQNQEHAHGQRRAREPRHGAGSTRAAGRSGGRVARPNRVRESYNRRPRAGTTPQALADLRGLSALPVVRFGRAPEVLLSADARRDVEQRGAEQPDRGVRRDPAQRRVNGSARRQGGRTRG